MSEDARRTVTTHVGGDAVVIPNGVYVDRFAERSAAGRVDRHGRAPPTIAFLGRMGEPRKGLPVLAAALPEVLREVPGPAGARGRARATPTRSPRAGRPRSSRPASSSASVSDADKASLLASVDVYVAPNTGGESFGIILIEAMSAGACVLASDLPAFSRVLDGGGAGAMFANEQPDDLARTLVALLRDAPSAAPSSPRAGQQRARLFDWSVVADKIMAVYETVIEGRMASQLGAGADAGAASCRADQPVTELLTWVFATLFVLVIIAWYLSYTAARLDRLHVRLGGTLAALDARLVRRAEAAVELANSGLLDGATALLLATAAGESLEAPSEHGEAREQAENDLTEALDLALTPAVVSRCARRRTGRTSLARVASACTRVQLARRFHNDAVTDVRRVRRKWTIRMFHLAGPHARCRTPSSSTTSCRRRSRP